MYYTNMKYRICIDKRTFLFFDRLIRDRATARRTASNNNNIMQNSRTVCGGGKKMAGRDSRARTRIRPRNMQQVLYILLLLLSL